jgi:hypothetical protein
MPSYDPSLFNVDPYYDDFSEDKKFLRLMFRPGYGVQARELTQIQTLLQNQIERMGSHVFEEGSIVLDGQISENRVKYAKVALGGSTENPADFIGAVISSSGKARARVVHAEAGLTGSTLEENRSVLFFEYMEGGTTFGANDVLAATAANGVTANTTYVGNTTPSLTVYATGTNANLYYYRVQITANNALANSNTVYTSSNARITLL